MSLLMSFYLVMLLYPSVQQKGRAEIDTIIGRDRLPSFEDREKLPYINAICMEIIRWKPVLPLGLPHNNMEADVYKGYYIPKGL